MEKENQEKRRDFGDFVACFGGVFSSISQAREYLQQLFN